MRLSLRVPDDCDRGSMWTLFELIRCH